MSILLVIVLSLTITFILSKFFKTRPSIPKGLKELPLEKGYPLLGILPQVEGTIPNYLKKLGDKHGPLYKIRLGMRDIVVLNSFDVLKKTLKDNGHACSGRLSFLYHAFVGRDSGLIFTDGDTWNKQRLYVISVLRDFGAGKVKSQDIVQNECLFLIDELRDSVGTRVDFAHLIPVHTANIISQFVMSKRFSRDDPEFLSIEQLVIEVARSKDLIVLLQMMFPFLDHSVVVQKLIKKTTSRWIMFDKAHSYFREELEVHRKRLDLNSEGQDLMDRFLIRQHKLKETSGDVGTFTDWQMILNTYDLFTAGFETTSTTLVWSLFFISMFPDIQEKVYEEIVNNIGNQKMVTMEVRKSLSYTQAVMDEIMRLASVVPLGVSHRTLSDLTLHGYFIPKNSPIFPNLLACHMDPNVWDDPENFRPDRFLTLDDTGNIRYSPREELIPFSIGKRQCLGEQLARMEYFIFFVSIIQHFEVSFTEKVNGQTYEEVLLGNDGVIRFPKIKDFIFSFRQK